MDWLISNMEFLVMRFGPHIMVLIVMLLLGSGAGLPVPEDIPLLATGYVCFLYQRHDIPGKDIVNLWVMLPVVFLAVVGADCTLYWLGRWWGHHVTRLPLLRRYLTPMRLQKAQLSFHRHGGKTLFFARFLPGLRAPVFFSAGTFHLPFWKLLVFDGSAALLSVPTLVLAAYFGGAQIEQVKTWTERGQLGVLLVAVTIVGLFIAWKMTRKRPQQGAGSAMETGPLLMEEDHSPPGQS